MHHTVSTDSRETAAGLVPRQPLDGATVESALCHSMSILSVPHHHVAVLCVSVRVCVFAYPQLVLNKSYGLAILVSARMKVGEEGGKGGWGH